MVCFVFCKVPNWIFFSYEKMHPSIWSFMYRDPLQCLALFGSFPPQTLTKSGRSRVGHPCSIWKAQISSWQKHSSHFWEFKGKSAKLSQRESPAILYIRGIGDRTTVSGSGNQSFVLSFATFFSVFSTLSTQHRSPVPPEPRTRVISCDSAGGLAGPGMILIKNNHVYLSQQLC